MMQMAMPCLHRLLLVDLKLMSQMVKSALLDPIQKENLKLMQGLMSNHFRTIYLPKFHQRGHYQLQSFLYLLRTSHLPAIAGKCQKVVSYP
jgi:hypothetical protein